jgi:SET domain-containing protein
VTQRAVATAKPFRVGRASAGLGLFATKPFKRGDFIIEYVGKRLSNAEADKLHTRYLFELNSRYTIDGSPRSNTARYINHACKPNAEVEIKRGRIYIYAIKRIEPGDEITYNYGKNYFEAFIKPMGCRCAPCKEKRSAARKRKASPAKTSRSSTTRRTGSRRPATTARKPAATKRKRA